MCPMCPYFRWMASASAEPPPSKPDEVYFIYFDIRTYLVIFVCLIWSLLEHCVKKTEYIATTLSKGVLSMQQLVLGDSVLTISRDKGLIYTEVN